MLVQSLRQLAAQIESIPKSVVIMVQNRQCRAIQVARESHSKVHDHLRILLFRFLIEHDKAAILRRKLKSARCGSTIAGPG